MNLLSPNMIRNWYRRAVVLPRTCIVHSEPSKYISRRFYLVPWAVLGLFLFFTPSVFHAAQTVYSASTQSNPLDNTNEAARSAAMGSAFTGLADDASALFVNPAGLGFLQQGQIFLNSDLWLVGTFQETGLIGFPTAGLGGFGLAAHYLNYGQMDGRDALGSVTASYSADRWGLVAGWGMEIVKDFSIGLGVHATQTTLADVGFTQFSSNIGMLWREKGLGFGASYVNAGWVSPGGPSEDAVNLGASYEMAVDSTSRLLTALGGSLEPNAVSYLQAGLEYSLQKQLFLRVGCQVPFSDNDLGNFTDFTAGIGFLLSGFSLDYAFLPYGDLGSAHRVSIGYFFGGPPPNASVSKNNRRGTVNSSTKSSLANAGGGPGNSGMTALNPSAAGPALPPLPPAVANPPAAQPTPSASTISVPASGVQPRAVDPSEAKDSLVVQFDLAPNSTAPSGAELEKEGKYREALTAYLNAVKQNPNDASSWWGLGNCYRELGQKTYAIQCFQQVLKLQPNSPSLANWLQQYGQSP